MTQTWILLTIFLITACAQAPVVGETPTVTRVESTKPPPPPPVPNVILPAPTAPKSEAPPEATPVVAKVVDTVWKLKKGKLQGPDQAAPKTIGTSKDPKSGAVTTTRCWKYSDFSIVESRTTGEVGAGEVNLRHGSGAPKENLCAVDFAGKTDNLNIIEGDFAGVAGDYILIEGADVSEGPPQFQILSLTTGKEILKSYHHADEEFTFSKRGHKTSLVFFAKIPVKCELAIDGEACWKKVLALSPAAQPTPMPNCKAAFAKAKVSPEETALVTLRAQVADLSAPKIQLLGGKATCAPAPLN